MVKLSHWDYQQNANEAQASCQKFWKNIFGLFIGHMMRSHGSSLWNVLLSSVACEILQLVSRQKSWVKVMKYAGEICNLDLYNNVWPWLADMETLFYGYDGIF